MTICHFCHRCNKEKRFEWVKDVQRDRRRWERYRCEDCGTVIEFAVT